MPVSHIGLTVSHLPTSSSFFLAALQPLGYRFIGQQGNQIGLGIRDADFFLCQETPGVKAGAAHIAFTAPDRTAVRDFYTAALNAGGRPNGSPASRTEDSGHFNAAILDFDGNSIEVVFRDEPDFRDDGTVIQHSRVLTWQENVAQSARDDRSVVSSRTAHSVSKQALITAPSLAPSKAPSMVSSVSKAASMVRSVSAPVAVPQTTTTVTTTVTATATGDGAAKKIIGTLLGAAAGAAVAYAMVRSEQDSAHKEAEFNAFKKAKALAAQIGDFPEQQQLSMQDPQPTYEAQPKAIHRNISDSESHYSASQRSAYVQRAIEPAPQSYHSPTYTSVPPTQIVERRAIEYAPAYSIAPPRSQFNAPQRSMTGPESVSLSKARSTVSRVHSVAPSAAPSTLISSFVPDQVSRRSSEGSVHSHSSSKSKAKSHVSHHTSASKHSSKSRSRAPSPPPAPSSKIGSKAASIVGSILGRDSGSTASKKKDYDDFEIEELDMNDSDTVAPSDSISNAGCSSRRSHRSHRSKSERSTADSVVSKHSSSSKHSKSSKHSHHSSSSKKSHHSSRSNTESSPLSHEWFDAEDDVVVVRPSVISEPSDASTVRPSKSSRAGRKDSGAYDGMFDGAVQYGKGSVATMPVRGITPSMIDDSAGRSMMSYALAQKMRAFEG
ncbi:hypothetical protein P154DRAFT_568754 [Amniculicola lignicola CBS 123094]|uniref:VOC domain-containing protein n=1 Tax=Amniculicola lignicola CBS 123094 TaxID=1392246 RepID=A0A6A5X4S8_9PLEO|nr:hypothetical protein P154DRAFT_568754 [Amniculicola lignicola CBS 123094]